MQKWCLMLLCCYIWDTLHRQCNCPPVKRAEGKKHMRDLWLVKSFLLILYKLKTASLLFCSIEVITVLALLICQSRVLSLPQKRPINAQFEENAHLHIFHAAWFSEVINHVIVKKYHILIVSYKRSLMSAFTGERRNLSSYLSKPICRMDFSHVEPAQRHVKLFVEYRCFGKEIHFNIFYIPDIKKK